MEKKDKLLQKVVKKVTSSKEEAIKFLKSVGIMTYKKIMDKKNK